MKTVQQPDDFSPAGAPSPPDGAPSAAEIIALLGLEPHPEGGFFRETFRDSLTDQNGRAASTLIYFLLPAGEISAWHRVDAVETWHYHAGAPLRLRLYSGEGSGSGQSLAITHILGSDLLKEERPQCVVPKNCWQSAESLGAWTLVSCGVAPGFTFSGFELAPSELSDRMDSSIGKDARQINK